MINIPTDRQVFEGEIATYWIDDNGILVSVSKSPRRTVANITENVALVKKLTQNKKLPLLIYLSNSPVPDRETQKFSTQQLPTIYSAMAMISEPGLASFILTLLFKFQSPPIPMQNFTNAREAIEWLKQYL